MRQVAIVGAGMTRFAKHIDRSMKDLTREAIEACLNSSGVNKKSLEAAAVGNAMAGLLTGQECIRGQVVLRDVRIAGIPVINTENACASAGTAFHLAWLYVASGMYDTVLAVGMEKLFHRDKSRSLAALGSAIDVELMEQTVATMNEATADNGVKAGAGKPHSLFMDFYAQLARDHMDTYGTTKEHYAKIAAKNHTHGSLNPHAQFQTPRSPEEVLAAPLIADPLTRLMCSPIGDGAAAVVLTSTDTAKRYTSQPVYIRASALCSGQDHQPHEPSISQRTAHTAYEAASIGPQDLDVAEIHDASAPAELMLYEELGLCSVGDGGRLIDEGVTALDGHLPVNPSGGLLAKGHPVGATGVAQIAEIFWQLRGQAGKRQVPRAKVGLTENGGGMLRGEAAAVAVHILSV